MKSFFYNKQIRKGAAKVLMNKGVPAKTAFIMIRQNMDYLFWGKARCDQYDLENKY